MISSFFRSSALFRFLTRPRLAAFAAAAVVAATLGMSLPAAADTPLTRADVEKIIHEYLMDNGQLILSAVEKHQTESTQKRYVEGVNKHYDSLFKDATIPFAGNPEGDVVIAEFFDYNCGFCKRVLPVIQDVLKRDSNVKFVLFDFPILGPTSETAARWALAAAQQGKYFEFHTRLMEFTGEKSDENLRTIAKDAGLDVDRAERALDSSEITLQIERNRSLANDIGITGTPAFLVDREVIPGATSAEALLEKVKKVRESR